MASCMGFFVQFYLKINIKIETVKKKQFNLKIFEPKVRKKKRRKSAKICHKYDKSKLKIILGTIYCFASFFTLTGRVCRNRSIRSKVMVEKQRLTWKRLFFVFLLFFSVFLVMTFDRNVSFQ